MTHRIYVIWSGHRKGCRTRRKLPGLRRGEWAHGAGALMEQGTAHAVAASLQSQGHQARVVDVAGHEVVIQPKVSRLRARIERQQLKAQQADQRARHQARPQLRLFGGAA